jgi:hypothetical protein
MRLRYGVVSDSYEVQLSDKHSTKISSSSFGYGERLFGNLNAAKLGKYLNHTEIPAQFEMRNA